MALNSINTNVAAYFAQANIGKASNMASSSIARLSSGNRIVRASDDVAAMSAGTSLRTNVTTLKMALVNTSQGTSMLQVADGALSQITDILQRQKAIAVQASAGSLTSQERSFLNQEFTNLTAEIDRLVSNTNFNGVTMLDGSLSEKVSATSNASNGAAAAATITFGTNIEAGTDLILNGVTITEGTDFDRGSSLTESLDNLVTALNDGSTFTATERLALSQAVYSRQGSSLVITQRAGGSLGSTYTIDSEAANSTMLADSNTMTRIGTVSGQYGGTTTVLFSDVAGVFIEVGDTNSTSVVANGSTTVFDSAATLDINDSAGNTVNVTLTDGMTLQEVVDAINADTANTGVIARIEGSAGAYDIRFTALDIRQFDGLSTTAAGNSMAIAFTYGTTVGAVTSTTGNETYNYSYSLVGGTDAGLGYSRTVAAGSMGDGILLANQQGRVRLTIDFPEIADADLLNAVDDATNPGLAQASDGDAGTANPTAAQVTIAGVSFGFVTTASDALTDVVIGDTLEETLDNLVAQINTYIGVSGSDFGLSQIQAYRDGNKVVLESKEYTDELFANDGTTTLTATVSDDLGSLGASVSNGGDFDNGLSQGVSTKGLNNSAFVGTITGFEATYTGTNDTINLKITVGGIEYNAYNVATDPTANTTVRLISETGGYFDIDMAANQGVAVDSQADADTFADRINAAFESLTFYQRREVSSYNGDTPIITNGVLTGSLIGTSFDFQLSNFSGVTVDSIRVNAPEGVAENGSIEITLNGQVYKTSPNIGKALAANSVIRLTSTENNDEFIEFRTGGTRIQFDTDAKAASFEQALREAFGVTAEGAGVSFQVGVTTQDTLAVSVGNVSTRVIFGGAELNVLTQASAAEASDAIDAAIDVVTGVRADVGALQSRFNYAAANVESSIQNQDAARGVLLDTDIASEATSYATAQVQLQAGIAVLAQANLLPQNLLKLIG